MDERTQAIIETIQAQRNLMADREAVAQGEIADLNSKLKSALAEVTRLSDLLGAKDEQP